MKYQIIEIIHRVTGRQADTILKVHAQSAHRNIAEFALMELIQMRDDMSLTHELDPNQYGDLFLVINESATNETVLPHVPVLHTMPERN